MWLLLASVPDARAWLDVFWTDAGALWGEKHVGASVVDLDHDGRLELVAASGEGGAVLLGWTGGPYLELADLTDTVPELATRRQEELRGLLVADLDNDGDDDLVRVTPSHVDVLRNDVPAGGQLVRAYTFAGTQDPESTGFEGAAILDQDEDGWLDVFVSEGTGANWMLVNPADGSTRMREWDLAGVVDVSGENSDFAAAGDWNGDGHVDLILRGTGAGADAYLGDGASFARVPFDLDADPAVKGGVALYDQDQDGVLDLYWTTGWDGDGLRVYRWNGSTWVERPDATDWVYGGYASVGFGDLDHDGLPEVVTAGAGLQVYTEGSTGLGWYDEFDYSEGLAPTLVDLDGDGDLDIYETASSGASRVLQNHWWGSQDWLQFTLSANVGTCEDPVFRHDVGGAARLLRPNGRPESGLLEVSGGTGRGQTGSPRLHVAGIDAWADWTLEVRPMVPGIDDFELPIPALGSRLVDVRLDDPDGDGVSSVWEQLAPRDPDGDGLATPVDPDADGDGIPDGVEAGSPCDEPLDSDGDGRYDFVDTDSDDDGLSDDVDPDRTHADPDGDGLTDLQELDLGTDPFSADTDGGGRSDGDEVLRDGTNPLDGADDLTDTDGDGVVDPVERDLGLDPEDPDTDGDGLRDGDELYDLGTDPSRADTDGDGLDDGDEVAAGSDPLVADQVHDRDGDGLDDDVEVALGTDPDRPDTDGDGALDGVDPDPLDPGRSRARAKPVAAPGFGLGCATVGGAPLGAAFPLALGLLALRRRR